MYMWMVYTNQFTSTGSANGGPWLKGHAPELRTMMEKSTVCVHGEEKGVRITETDNKSHWWVIFGITTIKVANQNLTVHNIIQCPLSLMWSSIHPW